MVISFRPGTIILRAKNNSCWIPPFRAISHLAVFDTVTPNPSMRVTDPATLALSRLSDSSDCITWSAKSGYTNVPASALWHRANGRQSKEERAEKQRYLMDPEEKALKLIGFYYSPSAGLEGRVSFFITQDDGFFFLQCVKCQVVSLLISVIIVFRLRMGVLIFTLADRERRLTAILSP